MAANKRLAALVVAAVAASCCLLCKTCTAFVAIHPVGRIPRNSASPTQRVDLTCFSSASDAQPPKKSRLAGNQREPTAQELSVMDEMIYKMANAKPYELPASVQRAFRVISSPRFFVRIAELTDQQSDEMEKEKLMALAANLVATLEAVVSSAQDKMEEYAQDVERVVKAAAEPDSGEFLVPLLPERIDAMRAALDSLDASSLQGDTFLSTVDAWMNKSHQDGMDLMVGILQKVLQLYAGKRILEDRKRRRDDTVALDDVQALLDELLQSDSDQWDARIRTGMASVSSRSGSSTTTTPSSALIAEIQQSMELTVLSLESGSLSQRVLAEYLQEMVKRVESISSSSRQ